MKRKNAKKVSLLKIIELESGKTSSLNLEKDTCHWQSMCYETRLRFNISLREIFFKSNSLRVMKNMMKVLSCRFYKSLGPFNMLTVKGVSETVFFKEWSNQVFHSLEFPKESSYDNHLFFKMFKIRYRFQKLNKKIRENCCI